MGKLRPRRNFRSLSTPYIQTHTTHNPSIRSDLALTNSLLCSRLSGCHATLPLSRSVALHAERRLRRRLSDEGLTLETWASFSLHGGNLTYYQFVWARLSWNHRKCKKQAMRRSKAIIICLCRKIKSQIRQNVHCLQKGCKRLHWVNIILSFICFTESEVKN